MRDKNPTLIFASFAFSSRLTTNNMSRFSLLLKFSITSLALLAVIGALLGRGLTQHFEAQAIEQQKASVSSLVPPVVGSYITDDILAKGARGGAYSAVEGALSYLSGAGLVAVKIWNKDGIIVYSDEPRLVGERKPLTEPLREALDGATIAELVPSDSSQNADQRGYGDLMRISMPLQLPGSTQVGSVFEGYYDVTDLRTRMNYTNGFLWANIAGGFFFLYVSLFTIVRNASSKLARQSEENAQLYHESEQRFAERLVAETQIKRQVEQLQTLRNIDIAITSNLDLQLTLNVILTQACVHLKVDAADALLLNERSGELEYAAGTGFRKDDITQSRVKLGEGYAGCAALQQRTLNIEKITNTGDLRRAGLLIEEDFVAYYAVPLVVKGHAKGVLEVFHRASLSPDAEWLNFLETLAGQAAIAADNASLFMDLQRSNQELAAAYDKTLEGWSRALDLRDKETEGHSRRVTEMAVRLAKEMGIGDEELVHIQRGALLHDIGKVGIPDGILLKSGPLTDEEWDIMRMHPVYAYDLLLPISFLGPALDIPYYHHEKWDGTGYPHGLKNEQIPLSARIFALADVWDALRSDRPYRSARPREMVYAYITEQAGKHFDPAVVETFLRMEGVSVSRPSAHAVHGPQTPSMCPTAPDSANRAAEAVATPLALSH